LAQAEIKKVLDVDPKKFWDVITTFSEYPEFVDGCKSVEIHDSGEALEATYQIWVIKDIEYRIRYEIDEPSGSLKWELVRSDFLKKNTGFWKLTPQGEHSVEVHYSLDIEFKIPVPGLILKKLLKTNFPKMIKDFEDRAKR
tara:strand:- start:1487 stop:1909 length:423 start_codon:yes stop_codon:yes gene_type:complete